MCDWCDALIYERIRIQHAHAPCGMLTRVYSGKQNIDNVNGNVNKHKTPRKCALPKPQRPMVFGGTKKEDNATLNTAYHRSLPALLNTNH